MKKLMMAAMITAAAFAATADNYGFTYQAELKDDKGNNLSSQNQTVEIRLWKTATGKSSGDLLWGRTYNIYTDKNGLFNQEISDDLGSPTSDCPSGAKLSTVFCNNDAGMVYIGLKVKESAGEIVPRQRLFAVPFAGKANSANNLVGDTHTVEGTLKIGKSASLGPEGLNLAATSTSTVGVLYAENVDVKNDVTFAGNLQFNGTLSGSDGKAIIPVPIGGVIMWTRDTPPEGGSWDESHWAICDGSTKNGITTPDLRGRFIVGVGTSPSGTNYVYGAKGGEEAHTLTVDELAKHYHEPSDKLWTAVSWILEEMNTCYAVPTSQTWNNREPATHGAGGLNACMATDYTGGDQPHENRPPYYALYYIMRVK